MQTAFSFDKESVIKMLKGAVYAVVPAAALALLSYLQGIQISNPLLAAFVVWAVPTAVNIVKEWQAGLPQE